MGSQKQVAPLLAFVGMPGSGKSVAVEYLSQKGWQIIHFGSRTTEELQRRGLEISESNERKVREELRETHGMEAYAKLSAPLIEEALERGPTVIDGLYSWSELVYLDEHLGLKVTVVAIFASPACRYSRLANRKTRPLTARQARERDLSELLKLEKGPPIVLADYTVDNMGTIEEFHSNLNHIEKAVSVPGA